MSTNIEQGEMEAMIPRGEGRTDESNPPRSTQPMYFRSFSSSGRNCLGKLFTRSHPFQVLANKAFEICDDSKSGTVDKSELYAGLLLVHLNLAKYAGPAACYPPTRRVSDILFAAADADESGGIDREEFVHIMSVLCAQILSRILVYYVVLILLVPVVAAKVVAITGILEGSYLEMAANQATSLGLFFVAIPLIWNIIDEYSERRLRQYPAHQQHYQLELMASARNKSKVAVFDVEENLHITTNQLSGSRSSMPSSTGRSLL